MVAMKPNDGVVTSVNERRGGVFTVDKRKRDVAVYRLVRSPIEGNKFCFATKSYLKQIFFN